MMECRNECDSCVCNAEPEETEWQRSERMEQEEHERELMQLLSWSMIAWPALAMLFGIWCVLIALGVLSESPVLGGTVITVLLIIWYFPVMRRKRRMR